MFSSTTPAKKGGKPDWADWSRWAMMQLQYKSQRMPQGALYLSGIKELGFFFSERREVIGVFQVGGWHDLIFVV